MDAVNGDKMKHSEWIVRSFNNYTRLRSSLHLGWIRGGTAGERARGVPCSGRGATLVMLPVG